MAKLGFIGLGIMGVPMASHLINAGNEVYLHTRSDIPQELLDIGGIACSNAYEVTNNAEIVFTMLPNTPHVEEVLFGENGCYEALCEGKYIVDMSTISPVETKEFAKKVNEKGAQYLDAPVSGGDVGAKNATLSIMIGAEENSFNYIKPYFELMGENITLVGPNGSGQITKLANNIVVALNIEAVSEALVFASKAGADPQKVKNALMGGFASSKVLDVHGQKMIDRAFTPGFKVELHQKDLNLALENAQKLGVSLPNTANTQQLFNACIARGEEKEDHASIVKSIENLSNHKVK